MTTAIPATVAALLGSCSLLVTPAGAVTYNFSVLNATVTTSIPHRQSCPCTDPVTGTTIFNASGSQLNGWTEGTGAGASTLFFMGDGTGNNGGKIYVPTGGAGFTIPTGQVIGVHNSQFTGDFALNNGFPLYFWFGNPGTTSDPHPTGSPVYFNGFDLHHTSDGSSASQARAV